MQIIGMNLVISSTGANSYDTEGRMESPLIINLTIKQTRSNDK